MSTWSLEHIPASGGASTFGPLKVWGIESFAWQRVNWGIDTLTVSVCGSAPAFSSAVWSYLDKIVLWRDGVRFAQVWCTFSQANIQPHQTRTYTLLGPGWWLTQYAPSYDIALVPYTSGDYMALALGNAVAAGAPIAYASSVAAALNVQCPEVRTSSTILELLQRACRYAPLSAGWWDYSAETPVFHAARRGSLTPLDLDRASYVSEPFSLSPRHDLQLKSVRLQFGWSGSTSYYYNTAGTDVELQGPNRLRVALSFSTSAAALAASGSGIAEKLMADLGPLCWTGSIPLHERAVPLPDIRPGIACNLIGTGCRAEWATMNAVVQQVTYNHQLGTDTASIELGVPEHLGPQDYLEFANLAAQSSASAAGEDDTYKDPAADSTTPGTYDDLNGGTGGGSPLGGVVVQARGGSWSKGGFESFDGSAPSRRWLTRTGSGTIRWDGDTGWESGWLACSHLYTLSGGLHYDAATLACTGEIVRTYSGSGPGIGVGGYCLASPVTPANWSCWCGTDYWCATLGVTGSVTATTLTKVPGEADVGWSGSHVVALSNEDTSDNAIARLMATSPDWADGQTAIRTVPTTGITGVYRALRYRTQHTETAGSQIWVDGQWVDGLWVSGYYRPVTVTETKPTLVGLTPWARYRVTVPLETRPVDSAGAPTGDGSWSSAGTRTHDFGANNTGEGGFDWQTVEPTAGYETRLGTPVVEAA